GAWVIDDNPLTGVPNPQDFGWGYEEGDFELDFDNAKGIVGTHYISPPNWWINFDGYNQQPPYDVLVDALLAALGDPGVTVDAIPTPERRAATVASPPYDENAPYQLSGTPSYWYGNRLQKYPTAPYPSMSDGPYPLITKYCVDDRIAEAEADGNT